MIGPWAHAEVVTPTDARAHAIDAQQILVGLNTYLADGYYHEGNFDKVVAALERVISLNPVGIEPYSNAAWLLWSSGKTEEAIDCYQRMVAANAEDPLAYFEFGFYYVQKKNDAEAVKWLELAVKHGLPSPKRHIYGIVLARLGRSEEALAFWQQVIAEEPESAIARREIDRLTGKTPTQE